MVGLRERHVKARLVAFEGLITGVKVLLLPTLKLVVLLVNLTPVTLMGRGFTWIMINME
jgi:hypothetical protein